MEGNSDYKSKYIMCDIYNDFTTHGLFSEKCLVCLWGASLENTSEPRERTRSRHNTQKSSHPKHHAKTGGRPASGGPVGCPPTASPRSSISSLLVRPAGPHTSDAADPGRGHVMQGWVCVSDALVFKDIILSQIVMSYKLHPT